MVFRQKAIFDRRFFNLFILSFVGLFVLIFPGALHAQQQGVTFLISPNQNLSGSAECPFITFQSWDGSMWNAWIKNDRILASPVGNLFAGRSDNDLAFVDHDGKPLSARFEAGKLILTRKGETTPCSTSDILNFKSWNGSPLFARLLQPFGNFPAATVSSAPAHVGPRFSFTDGEITDWQNNLVWKEGPDKDTTFDEAQTWITGLGSGWRKPAQAELRALFSRNEGGGVKGNMPAAFPKIGGTVVWAEENDASTAWYVGFIYANVYTLARNNPRFARAFAVRPLTEPSGH